MTPITPILALYLGFSRVAGPLYRVAQRRRLKAGKEDAARAAERFGHASIARPKGRLVWFHAASVGESQSILGLVGALMAARPDVAVLVTTGTVTSARLMARDLPAGALHQFAPYDSAGAVARFLAHWQPDLAVFTESELWPALLAEIGRRGIPAMLINARVSQSSARMWRKWPRTVRGILSGFGGILVQEPATAALMAEIGVEGALVTGSLKEDLPPLEADAAALAQMRTALAGRPVWLAASTHPGEEGMVLAAQEAAFGREAGAPLLIVVPRHPDRGADLAQEMRGGGWRVAQRSAGEAPDAACQVYLADTLGEMGLWYRLAPLAFVGGSMVGAGGHNPYEPAQLGCAILHGPQVFNFAEIHARLDQAGGALPVSGPEDLAQQARRLMADEPARSAMAEAAKGVIAKDGAALSRVLSALLRQLDSQPRGE